MNRPSRARAPQRLGRSREPETRCSLQQYRQGRTVWTRNNIHQDNRATLKVVQDVLR